MRTFHLVLSLVALIVLGVRAEDWPEFRGPTGQGHSTETGLPLTWSETQHVVWKVDVPGSGWSSPVVGGGRVWLTSAVNARGVSLRVLAFDVNTGRVVVNTEVARAGGAERFLRFMGDKLIPFIGRSYRTTPMRVLIGHSLGGLFAAYSLGKRPELFTGYILMEPSLWWNRGWERDQAKASLAQPVARHARVMLVNVESWEIDTTAWGGNKPMVRHLSTSGETHSSMAAAGMLQGLRTMFADFKPTEWRPGTRPIAMLHRYDTLAARVGYAVPIPEDAFATVARMSLDSRHFEDAAQVLDRMERTYGPSAESREYRGRLARERAAPAPAAFIPLEFPSERPSSSNAARFIGRWVTVAQPDTHEVVIRALDDSIVVHDRIQMRGIGWFEADDPVIQVTAAGTLEWGLPFFRGLAALVVLKGKIESDGTMTVTREVRGWVPRGPPGPDLNRTERFRRVGP